MMLLRCIIPSFFVAVALRVSKVATRVKNEEKKYSVEVGLSLAGTTGSAIDFSVNGVRRLTRTHPTQAGKPVVFHHLQRGSVITAYVHASESAYAYWVGAAGGTQHEVGDWSVSFTPLDESDQIQADDLYEVYVEAMGNGEPLTIEVNHAPDLTRIVTGNQILKFPGQHKGALVKATIASGRTCTYLVGNKENTCALDTSWGLRIGSVAEHGVDDHDEGVQNINDAKNYTVRLTVAHDDVDHSRIIELVLNKRVVARKKTGTDLGDGINLYHVTAGSVFFAVSHATGQACGIYVGSKVGPQSITCAGWTLDYTCEEEVPGTFDDTKQYDVSVSVFYGSTEPRSKYKVTSDTGVTLLLRDSPVFFPRVSTGWFGGEHITPSVQNVTVANCDHVVGDGHETTCEKNGWFFVINSCLNMNDFHDINHWIDDDESEEEKEMEEIETYKFMVMATYTGSKSKPKLACKARDALEYIVAPEGAIFNDITDGEELFWSIDLMESENKQKNNQSTDAIQVKIATNTGEIKGRRRFTGGFYCTVTSIKNELLCEADTDGNSMTKENGCTLHIEIDQS